ncbi:DUF6514 family protein [Haloimpatiens lingqiaonensis]|uniref:DUF6514 family protein n=1 Tax=Haloimpatiens lingqiaonensis TaxID=1380675 RepID=UPI001FAADC15|nr:DUF6514 family protein [Haloimpatiens lingqiaonensis]
MIVVENSIRRLQDGDLTRIYSYRLLKNEISLYFKGNNGAVQAYGIEVERQDMLDGKVINIQRDCVSSISPYRHKVHNLMKILYENTVSPIHLIDMVGEEVDYSIEDFECELKNILTN